MPKAPEYGSFLIGRGNEEQVGMYGAGVLKGKLEDVHLTEGVLKGKLNLKPELCMYLYMEKLSFLLLWNMGKRILVKEN